jgi:hypothetical protein
MFKTFVLVCMMDSSNICHTLTDLYGPYETRQECISRAHKIAAELPSHMPNYVAVKYKCLKQDDSEGKMKTGYGRDKEKETQKHWHEGSYHKGWSQESN